ncbi:MAG TPA: glycosyl transferase [Candidatus Paceibacterota bacterium]|nr:glycosyl transferase [Candidatus Paceibacterota bacterium]
MPKRHFVTLFDKGFLNRGLCLYRSIAANCSTPFTFWVLCMDDETHEILTTMNLPHLKAVSMAEFEDDELKAVKKTRTFVEYCWTLSAWSTWYVLQRNPDAETVTYVDGDLFYYASIEPIYEACAGHSVMIIPHRLHGDAAKREAEVGKYNVGMLIFNNDANARACLNWWKERCLEWCYDQVEPTRFGDQKYLDYFEEKFKGVWVLPWKGVNLASWNIEAYAGRITKKGDSVFIDGDPLIFFHFSRFKLYWPPSSWLPWGPPSLYIVPSIEKKLLYRPYAHAMYQAMTDIRKIRPDFTSGTLPRPSWYSELVFTSFYYLKSLVKAILKRN